MQGIHLRKYGVEAKIPFVLYEVDGVDLRVDAADGGSDCSVMKDEGAEATCTNDFVDEGKGYSITLTATEMQAARIVVYVVDSATKVWLDDALIIETYGHASAMHAFDLDTATESVSGTCTVETADTVFNLTATLGTLSDQDDCYHDMVICFFDNSGSIYESKRITDYVGASTRVTIHENLSFPVEGGVDTFTIYRASVAPVGAASITEGDMNTIVDKMHDEDLLAAHKTVGSAGYFLRRSGSRY